MKLTHCFTHIIIILAFLLASCSPPPTQPPAVMDVEQAVNVVPTIVGRPASTAVVLPEDPVNTPVVKVNTPIPQPTDVLALFGTPLPERSETIGINNYNNLKRIGQWGRGSIQGVAFAPDGKYFIAISELGWTIYTMDALEMPPQWVAYEEPILFDKFYFSSDGTMVKFYWSTYNSSKTWIRSFPSAEIQNNADGVSWVEPNGGTTFDEATAKSADGLKLFKSYVYVNPENMMEEKSVREMFDRNNQLLYSLRDDAPYVTYSDRNGPEGCDLSVFSPCGNALMPLPTTPVKTLFSANGRTFAALYAPTDLYLGLMKAFSYIRMYDTATGDLLGSLGGFTKPIQDFDYSPDGGLLVVGFVDGSIVLWDIANAKSVYGSRI